jgi:hypothetical protein
MERSDNIAMSKVDYAAILIDYKDGNTGYRIANTAKLLKHYTNLLKDDPLVAYYEVIALPLESLEVWVNLSGEILED